MPLCLLGGLVWGVLMYKITVEPVVERRELAYGRSVQMTPNMAIELFRHCAFR